MKLSFKLKALICSLTFLAGFSQLSQAQDYKSSIGGRLGTYAAASFTSYLSEGRSIEAVAGITRRANQTNYLFGGFYKFSMHVSDQVPRLKYYAGLGLYVNLEELASEKNVSFAPATMIGMEYTLDHTPVNFFLDISPYYASGSMLNSEFDVHANLGVRYVLSSYE